MNRYFHCISHYLLIDLGLKEKHFGDRQAQGEYLVKDKARVSEQYK